ncbi:bifunctional diguanylate cyclase/phosphodiesterase [Arcobacter cloacae]|uniref:Diguanylate cyclase n=1 Tax=Arcobacter cloacae TaxID=1054034 RepID=A0A4Q0ZAK7_9BACT|nr:GGDEF and EAL domain-containing protein [Arcobacter cloacae]RXJ83179.1 diguanylate cyclase [Arcobacter cloacae]
MDKNIDYYKEMFNNISEPVFLMEESYFIDANYKALELFNMNSLDELILLHPSQISPKYQLDGTLSIDKSNYYIQKCYKEGECTFEWLSKRLDNKTFLTEVNLKKISINNKDMIHATVKDIEIIKTLKDELLRQKMQLEQKDNFINKINETILSTSDESKNLYDSLLLLEEYKKALDESSIVSKADLNGVITYVNDKFCEISGYTKEELIGRNHNIIRHPDTKKDFFTQLWNTINQKKTFKGIIKNKKKSGQAYYVDSTIIPILDKNNNIVEYIAIRNDISALFEKDELIYEQFTDELTSLPNRQRLLNDLKNLVSPKLALINIDRFKDINNSYGIEIGDKILKSFAKRLLTFKSTNLNIYRISGDVFAFLAFGNFKLTELHKTCINLNTLCDRESFLIDEDNFDISFTIGIADYNEKILTHAEIALYWAKKINIDIGVFDENMPIYKDLKSNIELTKDIKQSLKDDNILIYGQKIIDNKTKNLKYETLMRMKLSNGKILSPFVFLEHAKKARLYPMMTKKVIEKSCEYFKDNDSVFSINLMIEDIKNEKTINFLFSKLMETKVANRVILEIVESEGIEKFEEVGDFIRKAKSLGCRVAIDDFGTGYSNFEYIIKLNVDFLKIDGSLIKNIHINENIRLTVLTIVNFAKVLGIKTVAEFVHCQEVQDVVESLGIDFSQGYLFHEPEHLV